MPNNKKILPDATKYDYMSTAFQNQQINGQISPNPTYNNSSISVPSFVKTAIITAKIEPAEEIGVKGMRFLEYQAEEVVQYYDPDDGDMSWKKVSELTDNATGPNTGALWSGGSLYEPFSNTFDYLVAFLNVKYNVGDIVTVSMLDNAYQPVELDSGTNQIKSKDLGIPLHNWGQRWFITGGLPKDGSATWEYQVSDDRTKIEIVQGSGAINYNNQAFTDNYLCTDCTQADGLKVFQSGEQIQFSAGNIAGANPSFTANATSGTLYFYQFISIRGMIASGINEQAGFSTLDADDYFTFNPPWGLTDIHGFRSASQGYQQWRGGSQLTSSVDSQVFTAMDYDQWYQVALCSYKAHESIDTPGKFLIYDISPIRKDTLYIDDVHTWVEDPDATTLEAGNFVGDCGIDITSTGSGTTTTLTFSVDNGDLAGAGLGEGSGCLLDVGQGDYITVNANDVAVDPVTLAAFMAGDCITDDGAGKLDLDITAGAGMTSAACELAVGEGAYIDVNDDDIEVDIVALAAAMAGDCLTATAGTLNVDLNAGAGINIVGCTISAPGAAKYTKVDVGVCPALTVTTITGTATDTYTVSLEPVAMAGNGLVGTDGAACTLDIGEGCGITVNADNVAIDPSAIAGDGLTTGTGTCNIDVDTQYSVTISGGKVQLEGDEATPSDFDVYSGGDGVTNAFTKISDVLDNLHTPVPFVDYIIWHPGTGLTGWRDLDDFAGEGIAYDPISGSGQGEFYLDISGLTAVSGTPPVDADVDVMAIWDSSASEVKKTTLEQLLESIDGYDANEVQEIVNDSGTIAWVTVEDC